MSGAARFIWVSARKDLQLRRRDWLATLLWLSVPLVIALLVSMVAGGGGQPSGKLLVADEGGGLAGRLVVGAFGAGELGEMFAVEAVDTAEGRARMEAGDASALLVIPEGFSEAVLAGDPTALQLVKNPAQRILPGIAEEVVSVLADGIFYLQQLFGDTLAEFAKGPPTGATTFPDLTVAAFSTEINGVLRRFREYLDPPLLELDTVVEEAESAQAASQDTMLAFFPGMLFMAMLFIAMGLTEEIWKEHDSGTLQRTRTTPGELRAFLAGKLLAIGAVLVAVLSVALASGSLFLDFRARDLPLAAFWAVGFGLCAYLGFLCIQTFAASQRSGSILGSCILFPLLMAGGSFFPFEAMPEGMAAFGRLTPNGWALTRFRDLAGGEVGASQALADFAVLLGAGGALFLLATRRVRKRFGGC